MIHSTLRSHNHEWDLHRPPMDQGHRAIRLRLAPAQIRATQANLMVRIGFSLWTGHPHLNIDLTMGFIFTGTSLSGFQLTCILSVLFTVSGRVERQFAKFQQLTILPLMVMAMQYLLG